MGNIGGLGPHHRRSSASIGARNASECQVLGRGLERVTRGAVMDGYEPMGFNLRGRRR
jgi:hypothetical protein